MHNSIIADVTMGRRSFIDRHGLWDEDDRTRAQEIIAQVESDDIDLIRLGFVDQHGIFRAKVYTRAAFLSAMKSGADMNTGPIFFDTANAIVFNPFMAGGGFAMEEMTGCPNLIMVPDPRTFRVLPWVDRTALIICDLYFPSGDPIPFSSRTVLKELVAEFDRRGLDLVTGLEVEWLLTRVVDQRLNPEDLGGPGQPGPGPVVTGVSSGFSYQSEFHLDEIADFLTVFADTMKALDLPLRTIEDEWGASQVETTFDPMYALDSADAMVLFRTATKQIARRQGLHASFMCNPKFDTFYSNGWHLHQSVFDQQTGTNVFAPSEGDTEALSPLGMKYLAGLLEHGAAATMFTTPTVNGYKRFKPNSLAPDRVAWGVDNRGSMCRVVSGIDEPSSRIENRAGEPAANPYLYIASQMASGLDGIDRKLVPSRPTTDPYDDDAPLLPTSLREAVTVLRDDTFFKKAFGDRFVDFMLAMRESELGRYEAVTSDLDEEQRNTVTEWEHREYFSLY